MATSSASPAPFHGCCNVEARTSWGLQIADAASGTSQFQDFAGPACASIDHPELWLLLLFTDHLITAPACILVFKLA